MGNLGLNLGNWERPDDNYDDDDDEDEDAEETED